VVAAAVGGWLWISGCRPAAVENERVERVEKEPARMTAGGPAAAVSDGWVECTPGPAGEWRPVAGGDGGWDREAGVLRIFQAGGLAGLRWTGVPPSPPFEVELEARRVEGADFFCGLTVPTRSPQECVSLIVGGWGGVVVGISSIDGLDASENETMSTATFENGRWYRIRLQFADERLAAWIDGTQVVDVSTRDRRLSLRAGPIEECAPFGLSTWESTGEIRAIRWRGLAAGK